MITYHKRSCYWMNSSFDMYSQSWTVKLSSLLLSGPYRFHSQNEISTFPQPFFWCSLNGHSQKKFWLWNFFKPPQPKIIYGCGTFWNRHSQKTFGCGNLISCNYSWVLTVNSQSDTVYSNGTEVLKILDSDSKIEVSQIIRDADSFIIKVKVTSNRS